MGFLFEMGMIGIAVLMILMGFKIYDPFRRSDETEIEALYNDKRNIFFKVGGVALLIFGILNLAM